MRLCNERACENKKLITDGSGQGLNETMLEWHPRLTRSLPPFGPDVERFRLVFVVSFDSSLMRH
jgi:hypothetical protein